MAPKQNVTGPVVAPMPTSNSQSSNGVITGSSNLLGATVNRKKAKRRAKEAARKTVAHDPVAADYPADFVEPERINGQLPHRDGDTPLAYDPNYYYGDSAEGEPGTPGEYVYSDDDQYPYESTAQRVPIGYVGGSAQAAVNGRRKRNKPGGPAFPVHSHPPAGTAQHYPAPRPISDDALRTVQRGINSGTWNMSNAEERRQIKEYWLSLRENERKALVKIEKNDVLQKMKDQQKHSCSCTVCGRKRVAIEEELEILYDAYYKELEQYANHNQHLLDNGTTMIPPPIRPTSRSPPPARSPPRRPPRGRVEELPEEEELEEDEGDVEEDYSDEEYDEDYSGDEEDHLTPAATEFFTFGNSLTVKGGILTVADDLLKNDGQKFIDMMEQLAERRMQREEQALNAPLPTHAPLPPQHVHGDHSHTHPEEEEYDDDEDEDYDSQDEEYEEEDDVDTMTESQRMEEGRRMFQIFAARMFEQRVLDAYRKKRSEDRANLLIEELEAEAAAQSQSGAKSAKKNEKKRLKEKAKKQALKEEKARKEEERAAAIADEEKRKQDEQRRRQEESKKKAEEKRLKAEAARLAQEEEKARRRAEEMDRKAKEQKAKEDKRRKDEAERKEKEAYERKVKEERDAREELERRERAKAEEEAQSKRQAEHGRMSEGVKRAPVPAVALPPTLKTRTSMAAFDSPQAKVVTPVLPKAPTPARGKDTFYRTSSTSTPQTPETTVQAKQPTPPSRSSIQQVSQPSSLSRSRTPAQNVSFTPQMSPMYNIAPPPGMSSPMATPHMGLPHVSPNGYPTMSNPLTHGMHRSPIGHQMPGYSPHLHQMGPHQRPFIHQNMGGAPPGINPLHVQNTRHFMGEPSSASGLKPLTSLTSPAGLHGLGSSRENAVPHARQPSVSGTQAAASAMEKTLSMSSAHVIGRPAPIGRPSLAHDMPTSRTTGANSDIDELGARLGSSALLDDNDEPLPTPAPDNRRVSAPFGIPTLTTHSSVGSSYDHIQSPFGQSLPSDTWRSSASAFGPPGLPVTPGWGQASGAGWSNPAPFPASLHRHSSVPRPVSVRQLAVQACRALNAQSAGIEGGYFDFNDVVRQAAESARLSQELAPSQAELQNILDTEGDAQNGGGFFSTKDDKLSRRLLIKWQSDSADHGSLRPGLGLGEIGSPLPGNSYPSARGSIGSRAF